MSMLNPTTEYVVLGYVKKYYNHLCYYKYNTPSKCYKFQSSLNKIVHHPEYLVHLGRHNFWYISIHHLLKQRSTIISVRKWILLKHSYPAKKYTFLSYFSTHSSSNIWQIIQIGLLLTVCNGKSCIIKRIWAFWISIWSTVPTFYSIN